MTLTHHHLRASKLKTLTLVTLLAGLSMGNEGCDQSKTRALRMEVELGSIQGRSIRLPNGEVVDFPTVANTLFYRQVMNSPYFMIAQNNNATNEPALVQSLGLNSKAKETLPPELRGYSKRDIELLTNSGFLSSKSENRLGTHSNEPGRVVSLSAAPPADENVPACLFNAPMIKLSGEIISFEATWGIGVGIGYGRDGSPIAGTGGLRGPVAGAKIDFSQSKLEMGLQWTDTFRRTPAAVASGISHQSDAKFGIDLTKPVGLDFFYKTPLADVVRKAIDRGLHTLAKNYTDRAAGRGKTWYHAWESRVMYAPDIADNEVLVAFRGGSFAGISRGDKFVTSNTYYKWKGVPCESALDYKVPSDPVAELEVLHVGDVVTIARATFIQDKRIRPGDLVKFTSFAPSPK